MAKRARNAPKPKDEYKIEEGAEVIEHIHDRYERNKKVINTTVTILLLAVVGIFSYFRFYKAPRNEKAMTAMTGAQQYFAADSLDRALNGDAASAGFLKVIKKYDGTDAANIAHYYAGMIYLKKGDFPNAIKYLKGFNGKGTLIEYLAEGALGDAYLETGKLKDAIEHYNKAAAADNDVIAANYLQRAGFAYEQNKQPAEAIKTYKKIRDEYPQSMAARDMDKNLARLGELE